MSVWKLLFVSGVVCALKKLNYYDTYTGAQLSEKKIKLFEKSNNSFWCTIKIEPCDESEGRRVDGSCNNIDSPVRGCSYTPMRRILHHSFENIGEPRKTAKGNDFPLPRKVRTTLLAVGRAYSDYFTQLTTHYLVFMSSDIVSQHDIINYIMRKPYCCTAKGKRDKECAPNIIPEDDPIHRFSTVRCLNMTRPVTYQSIGCRHKDSTPERIVSSTPLFDLSQIYGRSEEALKKNRLMTKGLLKTEKGRRVWPPSITSNQVCLGNSGQEKRCHNAPDASMNTFAGINLVSIWFWRNHNNIATKLAKENPCWTDKQLFRVARDINIAECLQIFYYELLPLLMGLKNLQEDGILIESLALRNLYNASLVPQVSIEFPYVLRWLHTMQEGQLNLYNKHGKFLKYFPIANLTLRTGFFDIENNIVSITQGSFRQSSGEMNDYTVDPDLADLALGSLQQAADVFTNDLAKGRYFGLPSYVKYREYCSDYNINSYDDLLDVIDMERIELLKELYEDINDVELLAGIWSEKPIDGGHVPATFYCLVVEQLLRNMVSDRHWYENERRPFAFRMEQLGEIRKMTIAKLLCDNGDSVTEIQPQAFLKIDISNNLIGCQDIQDVDLSLWKDPTCLQQASP